MKPVLATFTVVGPIIWCDNPQVRMWKILYINNNDFHHLGSSQMCAGAWYVFRTSKPHSGTLSYIFISITTNLQYLWFLCSLWWCEPPVSVVSCQCWCTRCHCRATRPHQPALVTPNMSPLFVNLATKTASDKQNIFNFNFLCVSCMLCLNWHFAFTQAETTDFQFETILISAR